MKKSLYSMMAVGLTTAVFGVACADGDQGEGPDRGTGGTDGSGGTEGSGGNGGASGVECADDQLLCDARCASIESDPAHCGECDNACDTGTACIQGECKTTLCAFPQVECNESCVNLQTDPANCGDCDDACAGGESCEAGQCVASCSEENLDCGGACVDPLTNREFCGATDCSDDATSGTTCSASESCVGGECRAYVREWSSGSVLNDFETTPGGSSGSSIATSADGEAIAIWRNFNDTDKGENDVGLYASHFDPLSKTWTPQVRLDKGAARVRGRDVAVDSEGNALAVWIEETSPYRVMISFFTAGGSWSDPQQLLVDASLSPGNTPDGANPAVAFDGAGNAHVAWVQEITQSGTYNRIAHAFYDVNAGAFTPTTIVEGYEVTPSDYSTLKLDLDVNADGDAILAWVDERTAGGAAVIRSGIYRPLLVGKWEFGVRSPAQSWPDTGAISVALDDAGNAILGMSYYSYRADQGQFIVAVDSYSDAQGAWLSAPLEVPAIDGVRQVYPSVDSNSKGDVILSFYSNPALNPDEEPLTPANIYAVRTTTSVADEAELNIETLISNIDSGTAHAYPYPVAKITEGGEAHVVWSNRQTTAAQTSTYDPVRQAWVGPINLNAEGELIAGGSYPVLTVAGSGHVFAGWYGAEKYQAARYD